MQKQDGFTLLELIVAVLIIGILAAVAIPQYAGYKSNAVDSQMKSALHNARTAIEAYYTRFAVYSSDEAILAPNGYQQTPGVTIDIFAASATDYSVRACANGGTSPGFQYATTGGATVPTAVACAPGP